MKIHEDVLQGSTEWLNLRAGIPTASEFDSILTPGGKASKSSERYLFSLLAERIMGHPRIESVSTWMDRGAEMEGEAVSFYELQRDCETVKVGFITNDSGTIGASPDRLVGDDGLLEIKVPSEHVHVSYLLKKAVDQTYYPQIQGQLWIAERQWVDICSYHPEMPPALIRVERDEAFIVLLKAAVGEFSKVLENMALELAEKGWIKPKEVYQPKPRMEVEHSWPASRKGGAVGDSESQGSQDSPHPFKEWLESAAKAKEAIGEQDYYRILKVHGFTHANQAKLLADQRTLRAEWGDCYRFQQSKANPMQTFDPMQTIYPPPVTAKAPPLPPLCPECGGGMKLVPAGVSKKSKKPYDAFYGCLNRACKGTAKVPVEQAAANDDAWPDAPTEEPPSELFDHDVQHRDS